jgi:hypothetical protein
MTYWESWVWIYFHGKSRTKQVGALSTNRTSARETAPHFKKRVVHYKIGQRRLAYGTQTFGGLDLLSPPGASRITQEHQASQNSPEISSGDVVASTEETHSRVGAPARL